MYVCGSNLEGQGRYSISRTLETEQGLAAYNKRQVEGDIIPTRLQYFQDFTQVQKDNQLSLPESFYEKKLPPAEAEEEDSDELLEKLGIRTIIWGDVSPLYQGPSTSTLLPGSGWRLGFMLSIRGVTYDGKDASLESWVSDTLGVPQIYFSF